MSKRLKNEIQVAAPGGYLDPDEGCGSGWGSRSG